MIRNLKALGLAMVAAFALGAVGATVAQAIVADVGAGGQTITGTGISVGEHPDHSFTLSSGRSFKCNTVLFEGTITDGAEEVIVTPTHSNCFSKPKILVNPVTVTHNGCSFRFYGNALNNVTVDLVCPEGKEMEVHLYASAGNHTNGTVLCTYTMAPFTGKHKSELTNTTTGTDDIEMIATVANISVKRVAGVDLSCGAENQTGIYTGATTVRVFNDVEHKNQVDLSVT